MEINGIVYEIIYQNEDNGYVVASIDCEGDEVIVVGYIPTLNEGESMRFTGEYTKHPVYGDQFKVKTFEQIMPSDIEGIVKYLSSGLIKGVGEKMALRIVEKFGGEALDIIQYSPHRLTEVSGIGPKKAEDIAETYRDQREMKEIIMFLSKYGISTTYAIKIYKKYGDRTMNLIKENPYRLADDISGIGFKMADEIAKNMGVSKDSPYRVLSGIKYCLNYFSLEGNTYAEKNRLISRVREMISVNMDLIEDALINLTINGHIHQEKIGDVDAIYLMSFFHSESGVAKKLIELSSVDKELMKLDVDKEIEKVEIKSDITLADNQKLAIKEALVNGLTVITGGPGTGKTTIVNSIIDILEAEGYSVGLAAPTGRAAKRITETTQREAKTIHRLLEYAYSEEGNGMAFNRSNDEPLKFDVIIIDEVSMVDILLMYHLLKAIEIGTKVILVGDADQLPSVGPGNVLGDIINSGMINVVKLTDIFRQANESMIVVNAHKINNGEKPILNAKDKDFYFMRNKDQEGMVNTIKNLCIKRLPDYYNVDPYKDIQVLTPMKNGKCGSINLNKELQSVLNPKSNKKEECKIGDLLLRVGDKVMQIKNNYNINWKSKDGLMKGEGVFNGDMGIVTDIDTEERTFEICYDDDRVIEYDYSQGDEIDLAYSITIHKSQGSEFPMVIMPIYWGPPMLLNRNLLYTAVTRAKGLVVMVGMEKYLDNMIRNADNNKRNTGLCYRMKKFKL